MINSDMNLRSKPSGYSYRVTERIWAGEYPVWEWNPSMQVRQLRLYTDFGITDFLDLTEVGEMPPYEALLPPQVRRYSFPIPNCGVPHDVRSVDRMFDRMEGVLRNHPERRLYIHCHGGVGRTGMIVACVLARLWNLDADEALDEMRRRFAAHARSSWMSAPETEAQIDFVRAYAAYKRSRE